MKIYQGTTTKPLTFTLIMDDSQAPVEVPAGTEITLINAFDEPGRWHANLTDGSADRNNLTETDDFTLGPVVATVNEG